MGKVNTIQQPSIEQLKELKKRVEDISIKMNGFVDKYNELIELIEKTDGEDKIPDSISNIGSKISTTKTSITKPSPNILVNIGSVMLGIAACESSCNLLCEKYSQKIFQKSVDI